MHPAATETSPREGAATAPRTTRARQRLKTLTSATSGWAKRLKAAVDGQRGARKPVGR